MDLRNLKAIALIVLMNILCFTYISSHNVPYSLPSSKSGKVPEEVTSWLLCEKVASLAAAKNATAVPIKKCCSLLKDVDVDEVEEGVCAELKVKALDLDKDQLTAALAAAHKGCGIKVPKDLEC